MTKDSLYIMHVEDHKTATEGVAKVVMDGIDHGRVVHYADTVREMHSSETAVTLECCLCYVVGVPVIR